LLKSQVKDGKISLKLKKKIYEQLQYDDKKRYNQEMLEYTTKLVERKKHILSSVPHLLKPKEDDKKKKFFGCSFCGRDGKEEPLLQCHKCERFYHPKCVEISSSVIEKIKEYKIWSCNDCKGCEVCNDAGSEDKLLICDACDRAFHTYCLIPPLPRPPNGGWRCNSCVKCLSCGALTPGMGMSCKWRADYRFCDACYQLYRECKYCPVCEKVYRHLDKVPMIQCDDCNWWIHAECDGLDANMYETLGREGRAYKCPDCRAGKPHSAKPLEDSPAKLKKTKKLKEDHTEEVKKDTKKRTNIEESDKDKKDKKIKN